jgi:Putative lumazine-binding
LIFFAFKIDISLIDWLIYIFSSYNFSKMKSFILYCLCAVMTFSACGQAKTEEAKATPSVSEAPKTVSPEQTAVEAATMQFLDGADKSDGVALDAVLHPQYRLLLNRVFGGVVSTMDKATYLKMIADKKIGGTPRQSKILNTVVTENVATVEVTSSSAKADFHSFLSFIKEPDGKWRLVNDTPFVKFKG